MDKDPNSAMSVRSIYVTISTLRLRPFGFVRSIPFIRSILCDFIWQWFHPTMIQEMTSPSSIDPNQSIRLILIQSINPHDVRSPSSPCWRCSVRTLLSSRSYLIAIWSISSYQFRPIDFVSSISSVDLIGFTMISINQWSAANRLKIQNGVMSVWSIYLTISSNWFQSI